MTEKKLMLAELLEKAGEGDFLRAVAEAVLQLLSESDVEGLIGAGRYERSGERMRTVASRPSARPSSWPMMPVKLQIRWLSSLDLRGVLPVVNPPPALDRHYAIADIRISLAVAAKARSRDRRPRYDL